MGLKFDEFDVELFLLQQNMREEVVKVFKPFIAFLKSYGVNQVYNMITIMLDP
jgi:DNA-binding protein Fis